MKPSGQKRQTAGFDHEPEHRTFFPELSPAIHSLLPTVASCPFEPRYPASPVLSHLCFLTCAFSPVLSHLCFLRPYFGITSRTMATNQCSREGLSILKNANNPLEPLLE